MYVLSSVRGGFETRNSLGQGRVEPLWSVLVTSENVVVLKVLWSQEAHVQPPSPSPAPTHTYVYMCRKQEKYSEKQRGKTLLRVCTAASIGVEWVPTKRALERPGLAVFGSGARPARRASSTCSCSFFTELYPSETIQTEENVPCSYKTPLTRWIWT